MVSTLGKVIKNLDMIFFENYSCLLAGCVNFHCFSFDLLFLGLSFFLIPFASTAGGLRNCNAAAFASLKNLLRHFLIPINRDRTKRGGLCNYW
jgi:hypothetical protein